MDEILTFRVSVDEATTAEAALVLQQRGWSVADAIRVLLTRTAKEHVVPFTPRPESQEALDEVRRGGLKRFDTVEALMADLNADD